MRKLVRIGSNVRIPGDSRYRNKNIVLAFLKKIEMRKMTMPNFCINFLNKAEKSLPILYDFAVASLADAWIETWGAKNYIIHTKKKKGRKKMDGIIIRKAILHVLDNGNRGIVLSNSLLNLRDEQMDFIHNLIGKIHGNDNSKHGKFNPETSFIYKLIQDMNEEQEESFIDTSQEIAKLLFSCISNAEDVPSGDLLVLTYRFEGGKYLALLKLNYKSSYTQLINQSEDGVVTSLIRNTTLLPSASTRPTEAAIIKLSDLSIRLVEKKYNVDGTKVNYFSESFLGCNTELASKKKLNLLDRIIRSVTTKYYDGITSQMDAKSALLKDYMEDKEIDIEGVGAKLFGHSPEMKSEYDEKIESYDMQNDYIKIENDTTVKKLEKMIIVTDLGIEISIPTEIYNRMADVEIKESESEGSQVIIKNISSMHLK